MKVVASYLLLFVLIVSPVLGQDGAGASIVGDAVGPAPVARRMLEIPALTTHLIFLNPDQQPQIMALDPAEIDAGFAEIPTHASQIFIVRTHQALPTPPARRPWFPFRIPSRYLTFWLQCLTITCTTAFGLALSPGAPLAIAYFSFTYFDMLLLYIWWLKHDLAPIGSVTRSRMWRMMWIQGSLLLFVIALVISRSFIVSLAIQIVVWVVSALISISLYHGFPTVEDKHD